LVHELGLTKLFTKMRLSDGHQWSIQLAKDMSSSFKSQLLGLITWDFFGSLFVQRHISIARRPSGWFESGSLI